MRPFLIRHLKGQNTNRLPVWMMRQAGRYLPEYRAIRDKYDFWERVTNTSLAVEISLQPLIRFDMDAVIFFSDILTLPYGLGCSISLKESVGPIVASTLRSYDDFRRFKDFKPQIHVPYVGRILKDLRKKIPESKALLGFSGAPWTVSAYLVEGKAKTDLNLMLQWVNENPKTAAKCLTDLNEATIEYLKYQIASGADLVQVFDTWLPKMPVDFFNNYYKAILNDLFRDVKKLGVPVIYFAKDCAYYLDLMKDFECDVISVGSSVSLREADRKLCGKFSLQGNLDPRILLLTTDEVRSATRKMAKEAFTLSRPAICNLGHGVLPNTPIQNVHAFLDEARRAWN